MKPPPFVRSLALHVLDRMGLRVTYKDDPRNFFHNFFYLRHNARRLEHLASLDIPLRGKKVLELGAGIGDHTHYYADRGCTVTITEPREDNLKMLRRRFPECEIIPLDLEAPGTVLDGRTFEVVHSYGLLYHLSNPEAAIKYMADRTNGVLLLETCVSFDHASGVNQVPEPEHDPTQALSGTGCRPARSWVFQKLKEHFPFVYIPLTQPNHPEFPVDWTRPDAHQAPLTRAIFVASRQPIDSAQLTTDLLAVQERQR